MTPALKQATADLERAVASTGIMDHLGFDGLMLLAKQRAERERARWRVFCCFCFGLGGIVQYLMLKIWGAL